MTIESVCQFLKMDRLTRNVSRATSWQMVISNGGVIVKSSLIISIAYRISICELNPASMCSECMSVHRDLHLMQCKVNQTK